MVVAPLAGGGGPVAAVGRVGPEVLVQVVRPREGLVAHRAGEALLASVRATVPRQLKKVKPPI